MKKAYVIAPLAASLAFAAVYGSFHSGHKAREAARLEQQRAEREARTAAEAGARRKAIEEAVVAQAARKKEREEKDALEKTAQAARQLAVDARDQAFREQERASRQIERVKKDIAAEEESLARLDRAAQSAGAERAFLAAYVKKAEDNARSLEEILLRFDAAEKARLAAAQADTARK